MKKLILICALALAFVGCKNEKSDEPDVSFLTLVTYQGTDETQGISTFTFQAIDDSPLITLTAAWKPTSELKDGARVMLDYYADNYQVSGPVTVRRVTPVIGSTPSETTTPLSGNIGIHPATVWRSGPYLNAYIEAYVTGDPVTVKFALDKSTVSDAIPVYYLALDQTNYREVEAYRRIATMSYDISDVWNLPTCEGVKVYYRDMAGNTKSFENLKTKKQN